MYNKTKEAFHVSYKTDCNMLEFSVFITVYRWIQTSEPLGFRIQAIYLNW